MEMTLQKLDRNLKRSLSMLRRYGRQSLYKKKLFGLLTVFGSQSAISPLSRYITNRREKCKFCPQQLWSALACHRGSRSLYCFAERLGSEGRALAV